MNCPTCNKPTPPDSVHTCSPVPLLTEELVTAWLKPYCGLTTSAKAMEAVMQIQQGRVACYDTATHKAVTLMTEDEARERFEAKYGDDFIARRGNCEWIAWTAALRDIGAIRD